jgi:isopentenyldiphosphate isomerase
MTEMWDILNKNGEKTGVVKPRGPLGPGEFHQVVQVWILNSHGEFLVSKRTPNKPWPLMWECTGGSAAVGEDSLTAALKEVREELGVILDPANGQIFRRFAKLCHKTLNGSGSIIDAWLFRQNVDLKDITLCPDETCDVILAKPLAIMELIKTGQFIDYEFYPYLDDLFHHVVESPRQNNP